MVIPATVMDELNFVTGIDPTPRTARFFHRVNNRVPTVQIVIEVGDDWSVIWSLPLERLANLLAQGEPGTVNWWEFRMNTTEGGTLAISQGSTTVEFNTSQVRLFMSRSGIQATDAEPEAQAEVDEFLGQLFPTAD
jgi:hypothetical protein